MTGDPATLVSEPTMTTGRSDPGTAGRTPTGGGRNRLSGLDAARGIALLAMMAVHSLYVVDEAGRPTWWYSIFGGRAAAVFAVLAGVGLALTTGRRRVRAGDALATTAALGVRALLIGAAGLALGYTDPAVAAVILPYYAVMFLLAIPLVFLPTGAVAVLGGVLAIGMPALSHALRADLPAPTMANITAGHLVDDPVGLLTELSLTGYYPALPWLAYLCAGLVIGRLDLTRARVAGGLLLVGTALAATAAAVSTLLLDWRGSAEITAAQPGSGLTPEETQSLLAFGGDGTTPTTTWWWLAVNAPHTGTPPYLVGTIGTAMALLGLTLLAGHHIAHPTWRRVTAAVLTPLAAAGALTFSLYAAHIVFINSSWDTFDATDGYLLQVAVALPLALGLRATIGRGPLEGALYKITKWVRAHTATRSQPVRRQSRATAPDVLDGRTHIDDQAATEEVPESHDPPHRMLVPAGQFSLPGNGSPQTLVIEIVIEGSGQIRLRIDVDDSADRIATTSNGRHDTTR
ncbi:MAG TPA: heparan-alpha-glucosaminide N-acetyltransferase domain-containing protein [Micromonosporaceae bacterium]